MFRKNVANWPPLAAAQPAEPGSLSIIIIVTEILIVVEC